jgi:hypothetical protein
MWRWLAIAAGVLTLSALSGVGAYQLVRPAIEHGHAGGNPGNTKWQEIAWTFPRDGWPAGRAFRCASCGEGGGGVELYVRPKIGFCNCDTGVADDDEVDRVADLDLISARFAPTEAGKVVHVAGMAGRSRSYDLKMGNGAQHAAIGIALSHRCDLLVAVAQGSAPPSELQHEALAYLASREMHRWMLASLGGR